uniref:Uncharacterized protein n=1 Tax=Glycine max TaxID=3847 RepID=A0A0R0KXH2_SOYBN
MHFLQAHFNLPRRTPKNLIHNSTFRLWPNPSNIHQRCKLPHSKIPQSPEHSGSKCIHFNNVEFRRKIAILQKIVYVF